MATLPGPRALRISRGDLQRRCDLAVVGRVCSLAYGPKQVVRYSRHNFDAILPSTHQEFSARREVTMTVQQETKAAAAKAVQPSPAIRIPISNVKGGGDYTGQIKIGSKQIVANVILDTGSSTLAVVPRVYKIANDTDVSFTPYAQQVMYGTGGWSGPVIQTSLSMGSAGQETSVSTYMAIVDEQLPNNFGPADGILGLAFNALNSAFNLQAYLTSERVDPPVTYPWPFPSARRRRPYNRSRRSWPGWARR